MEADTTRKGQDTILTTRQLIQDLSESEKTQLPDGFDQLPFGIQRVLVRRIKRYRDPEYAARIAACDSASQYGARNEALSLYQRTIPIYCRFPTPMCRVSVIHPINRNTFDRRPYIEDRPIVDNSWGTLHYTGPLLSTYDEDVLFAVLALVEHKTLNRELIKVEGRVTYQYTGLISEIFGLYGKARAGANYAATFKSLKRLMAATVGKFEINGKFTHGKHELQTRSISNLLINVGYVGESKRVRFLFNPYFYDALRAKNVTYIDVAFRSRINSLIAKSLYRFCQSHRSPVWYGDWRHLIDVLNIDRLKQDGKKRYLSQIKRLIAKAVEELVEKGYLQNEGSGFVPSKNRKHPKLRLTRVARKPLASE